MTFAQWFRGFVAKLFDPRANAPGPRANAPGPRANAPGPRANAPGPRANAPGPRANALLLSSPTSDDRRRLLSGFVVTAEDASLDLRRFEDQVIASLRLAESITFDADIPLVGGRNILAWLRGHVREFRVKRQGDATNLLPTMTVLLPVSDVDPKLVGDSGRAGPEGMLLVICHEARHLQVPELGHNCDEHGNVCGSDLYCRSVGLDGPIPNDASLAMGGAWALHYYLALWMADHAPGWFSESTKTYLRANANHILVNRFCDNRFGSSVRVRNFPARSVAGKQSAND